MAWGFNWPQSEQLAQWTAEAPEFASDPMVHFFFARYGGRTYHLTAQHAPIRPDGTVELSAPAGPLVVPVWELEHLWKRECPQCTYDGERCLATGGDGTRVSLFATRPHPGLEASYDRHLGDNHYVGWVPLDAVTDLKIVDQPWDAAIANALCARELGARVCHQAEWVTSTHGRVEGVRKWLDGGPGFYALVVPSGPGEAYGYDWRVESTDPDNAHWRSYSRRGGLRAQAIAAATAGLIEQYMSAWQQVRCSFWGRIWVHGARSYAPYFSETKNGDGIGSAIYRDGQYHAKVQMVRRTSNPV
ncbi:MAG TPA: hypothetical protein VNT01_09995 [Symbiobacteriaceae bacterium]|nr:hypothetical protein [Symbiobacteriaceae bacterium]